MAEKKRELWADYAKGICILLVFIGHSDAIPQAVRIFIYLFHMPMFFFCMGYYSSTAGTFGVFVKKRFRQLMVPFFAYGILYHVLCLGIVVPLLRGGADWALCRDNILGLLVQLRGTDLVAPKWFLTAAFVEAKYPESVKMRSWRASSFMRCESTFTTGGSNFPLFSLRPPGLRISTNLPASPCRGISMWHSRACSSCIWGSTSGKRTWRSPGKRH